ncbi:uronyl 2-sulfotransferase isoform X3 [Ascaphus truei]|uniref:uronyl 2-sulfotransferase isoform X3 n=1 Tax=Ascaphus truei TaxID=8439 RepID=UPI003F59B9A8
MRIMKKNSNNNNISSNHAPRNNVHGTPKKGWRSLVSLQLSLRDYGFCMATLLLFCIGSLFYQLNGGPPQILLDLRLYLGNSTFLDDHDPHTPKLELIKNISTAEQPYLFTRHVHFLNFSRFGAEQPVYINIIRDPVNRFLSNYFFRRFGDWRGEQNHMIRTPGMKEEERYLDINECILENYAECSNPRLFYIIPYFCGQHPKCRDPGEWALERAKQNVYENFLLVGILEELEDVLLLLERFLPHYFKDVLGIYKNPEHKKLGNLTVTVKKAFPSPNALQVLYQRMKYEYEFYYYVKEQFNLLKRKFGLKSNVKTPPSQEISIPIPMETEEPAEEEEDQNDEKWLEDIYKR